MIAPLDWGLGHATRCIPVIRHLIDRGCDVTLAASGPTATLLQANFPDLPQLSLDGYGITYSRTGGSFVFKILSQIPEILRAIRRERQWLHQVHSRHHFDLVISDNRYGLKIDALKSVILTHQLQIRTGLGTFADYLMQQLHYRILGKFDECWVVDEPENGGLAGALSHPSHLPARTHYIGLLSQLHIPATSGAAMAGRILVLLSGPEPMRSMLEAKIMAQTAGMTHLHFHIIAGKPDGATPDALPAHITYATHADASQVAEALSVAGLVVCRSGYSTLMDLAMLGKKALLIPTPGQSEQAYLARHLQKRKLFLSRNESQMDLKNDIPAALHYPGFTASPPAVNQRMKTVVDRVFF